MNRASSGRQPVPSEIEQRFTTGAALLGIDLTARELGAFRLYHRELVAWNRRANLTAITEYDEALIRHFLDSLTVIPALRRYLPDLFAPGAREAPAGGGVIDIGTGAGFPGLPLAIACPWVPVVLMDATAKKTAFCRHMVELLGLPRVEVVTARAEELAHNPGSRGQYTVALSRAVASLPTLAEYLLPFCRPGGVAVAMKKGDIRDELAAADHAIALMAGEPLEPVMVTAPGLDDGRVLVVMRKTGITPEAYPRRPGVPRKRPLSRRGSAPQSR